MSETRTIEDFGEQWTIFRDNEGYYGSLELFRDMFEPLVSPEDVRGRRVADIGSGSGRIVNMLLAAGAAHVVAVEPSRAFEVLRENTASSKDRVTLINARGDELPPSGDLDLVFSYGVLHHIEEPLPVARAALAALHPGGRFVAWLYGKEGNRLYLAAAGPLRAVTTRLPHWALNGIVWPLDAATVAYIALCRSLPLPMRNYMLSVMAKLSPEKRRLNIYDQLNPAYAKYYTREECLDLFRRAGFADIRIHHRHGYSWTVVGTRPG